MKTLTPYEVARIIGFDNLEKLCEAHPTARFNVPKRLNTLSFEHMDDRNEYIRNLSYFNKPNAEIAAMFGISEKRVRDIVNKRK